MRRLLRLSLLGVLFAMSVTATTYGVFALVYWRVYAVNVALVRQDLRREMQQTVDAPVDQLRRILAQELRQLDYIGLYDQHGVLVFGNVASDMALPTRGTAGVVKVPGIGQAEKAIFEVAKRPDGGTLVLGRSLDYVDQLETAMLGSFAAALPPVILLALLGGTVISARQTRRLAAIQQAIDGVRQGYLQTRLPVRDRPDAVDEVAGAVNTMLDEIGRLVGQIQSVGDNIAHDLRSPLAVMRARLDRGLAGGTRVDWPEIATASLADLERAMATVAALLRIAELESGKRRRAFRRVDMGAICHEIFTFYEAAGDAKNIEMSFHGENPLIVYGDGDLLREAFANLIDNAIKFTPPGGRVVVQTGGASALVRIADNGPGIAPGERKKVLRRFYRAERTTAEPGTGLGLSMAATIIELHGFGLRIGENSPGAVFDIIATAPLWEDAGPAGSFDRSLLRGRLGEGP